MPTAVIFNGTSYNVPLVGETGWGSDVSDLMIALSQFSQTKGSASQNLRIATTSPVSLSTTDYGIAVNVASASVVDLPVTEAGRLLAIIDGSGAAQTNNITIQPPAGQTINGLASLVIDTSGGGVIVQFEAGSNNWKVISSTGIIKNADISATAGIVDTKLATIATAGKVSNSATTATSENTANAIVSRDGSGGISVQALETEMIRTSSGSGVFLEGMGNETAVLGTPSSNAANPLIVRAQNLATAGSTDYGSFSLYSGSARVKTFSIDSVGVGEVFSISKSGSVSLGKVTSNANEVKGGLIYPLRAGEVRFPAALDGAGGDRVNKGLTIRSNRYPTLEVKENNETQFAYSYIMGITNTDAFSSDPGSIGVVKSYWNGSTYLYGGTYKAILEDPNGLSPALNLGQRSLVRAAGTANAHSSVYSNLEVESVYSADQFAANIHVHRAGNYTGMFLGSYGPEIGIQSTGSHYHSSNNHRAAAGTAAIYQQIYGSHEFYSNTGLTPGNTFGPLRVATIGSNGQFVAGTTAAGVGCRYHHFYGEINTELILHPGGGNATMVFRLPNSATPGWTLYNNAYSSNRFYVADSNFSHGVYISQDTSSWTGFSDERFKTNWQPIENAVDKVCEIATGTYNWIDAPDGKRMAGVTAQSVLKVFPEPVDTDDPDKLGVRYDELTPLALAAIKELKAEINALKSEIAALKAS